MKRFLHLAILASAMVGCREQSKPKDQSVNPPTVTHAHTNRLAREKSPYLLQHAHNPVDWFAWGDEAFEKARRENKPIFLSIGYSTCHWCHVMERESFENETVAKFLNAHFVAIKVDREERPDVDKIYMTAVQVMGEGGGWPLNVFLTPELKPFYGGTYFPPEPKYGRPSFLQLLERLTELWTTKQSEITGSATNLHSQLEHYASQQINTNLALSPAWLQQAGQLFKEEFDQEFGGFAGPPAFAPKFPRPSQPAFLLRAGLRFHDPDAVKMVLRTCDFMAAGGIRDHLGGGFARYSVDRQWLVPHFEKMLYDNAQLIHLYLDAYLVSGDARHADTARDTIRYVLRDMRHPGGGFYSAEDADSEGHEGKFYCWTRSELEKLLTPAEFSLVSRVFGITEKGNFTDHSHPAPLTGQNVLSLVDPRISDSEKQLLTSAKNKMFDVRAKRIRPHLDDKVLASWNGMMLGALARAYAVLGDSSYREAAEKNLHFLQEKLWDAKTKTLYHRWRDGERDQVQLVDAYADLLAGVLDLYQATLDPAQLDFAIALSETMLAKFYDPSEGGFFQSAATPDLILRVKEDYDGAEPSANSIATLALLKLAAITDRHDFRDAAEKTLRMFSLRMQRIPQAVPQMLLALDFALEEPSRLVIVGDRSNATTTELIRAAHSVYRPNKVILGHTGAVESFARGLPTSATGPQVFLCTGTACQAPTGDPAKLKQMLAPPKFPTSLVPPL